jgi:hypothetical protein
VTSRLSRAERMAMPLGSSAIRDLIEAAGGCIRPIQLRRTNEATGEVDYQFLPPVHARDHLPALRPARQEPPGGTVPRRMAPRA